MGPTEAREAFFATTRLFQSKDVTLRRMLHLVIKELPTAPDDAIIATSRLISTIILSVVCMIETTPRIIEILWFYNILNTSKLQFNKRHDRKRRRLPSHSYQIALQDNGHHHVDGH